MLRNGEKPNHVVPLGVASSRRPFSAQDKRRRRGRLVSGPSSGDTKLLLLPLASGSLPGALSPERLPFPLELAGCRKPYFPVRRLLLSEGK